jgi:hypothetical protein
MNLVTSTAAIPLTKMPLASTTTSPFTSTTTIHLTASSLT